MSTDKLFLETTIQIERIFGRKSEDIFEFLRDKEVLTSNYVLMEFKKTIIKDCTALYTYLKEEKSLSNTFKRLARLRSHEHRIASRIFLILSELTKDTKEDEKILEKLEDLIESELLEYFFYMVNVIDETKCGLANEEVHKNETYSLNLRCRRNEKNCEIEEFVARNKEEFKKLLNDLQAHKEFERSCRVIEEILKDCEKARGKTNCWKLSDFIISIEAPKNYKIFTTDHHYEQICNSLDKDILLLQNLTHATTYRL
ncbi:MAG: hypothetical protein H8D26_06215 [Methanomicrobia archaeon]|nr:hypothetical protein [Methanomicrobia archaeon]